MVWLPFLLRRPRTGIGTAVAAVALSVDAIAAVHGAVSPIDVSVDIYIHIVVNSPPIPIAIIRDNRPPCHTDAEGNQRCHRVVDIRGRGVVDGWRVARHVDDLRVGRCDLHDLVRNRHHLRIIRLQDYDVGDGHNLLSCASKCAGCLGFGAQLLDCVH